MENIDSIDFQIHRQSPEEVAAFFDSLKAQALAAIEKGFIVDVRRQDDIDEVQYDGFGEAIYMGSTWTFAIGRPASKLMGKRDHFIRTTDEPLKPVIVRPKE